MSKGNGKTEGKIHLQKADLKKVDLHPRTCNTSYGWGRRGRIRV